MNQKVYVIGGVRTPFVKSFSHFKDVSTQELLELSLKALVEKYQLQKQILGDVALGAVMNSSKEWPMAREAVLSSGLHPYTPAYFVQRACGTGLEAALQIALKISSRQIEWGIAGGVDTNSDLPLMASEGLKKMFLRLNAARSLGERLSILTGFRPQFLAPVAPMVAEKRTGLSMGEHCELMVKEWKISREAQDELAFVSHQRGAKAYDEGFYKDLVCDVKGLAKDTILRADTTLEKLKTLKPAFDKIQSGTLTAGNSTPLTDGSSVVLLASEAQVEKKQLKPLARFVDAEVAALDFVGGDGLLMAPTVAVSRLLERNQISLQDFDYYEIHEAFAGQVLCTLKAWESEDYAKKYFQRSKALGSIDRTKMNVKGGSLALGHPFAATGGRIVSSLAKILAQSSGKKRGLISICTAGGMGVAAILETV
ncbi:acetyl-CoA C-acetyltransferase [bacterium]|nr:acetyl-CoA C-acetyltransferase [bacterium]